MNHDSVTDSRPSVTAEAVAALFAQADIYLAIAELGTGGAVAAALRSTEAAGRIASARVYAEASELAEALRVSEAKMAAFGAVSAMVAAEAAAALIDTYEGGWGLAVLCRGGNGAGVAGVTNLTPDDTGCFIALGTPSATEIVPCAPERVVPSALALLKSAAEVRLATPRPY
ncbi:MAG: CinA family protein [Anaerolineae bacterium]|jgi:nicotinamide mononucleotide (NMN) deamidase PncC|nr:CinA family protein [Anaerolineae bacterium]